PDAPGNDWDFKNPGGDKHLFDEKLGPNRYRSWYDVHPELVEKSRKYVDEKDPNVVINSRAARGMGKNFGDYVDTADNPAEVREAEGDWEAIPTVNNSYGYNKLDNNYKTAEFFIRLSAKITAKGGNTLLNIGAMGTGEIDPNATAILEGIGQWMHVNGEPIHGCPRTPLDR